MNEKESPVMGGSFFIYWMGEKKWLPLIFNVCPCRISEDLNEYSLVRRSKADYTNTAAWLPDRSGKPAAEGFVRRGCGEDLQRIAGTQLHTSTKCSQPNQVNIINHRYKAV